MKKPAGEQEAGRVLIVALCGLGLPPHRAVAIVKRRYPKTPPPSVRQVQRWMKREKGATESPTRKSLIESITGKKVAEALDVYSEQVGLVEVLRRRLETALKLEDSLAFPTDQTHKAAEVFQRALDALVKLETALGLITPAVPGEPEPDQAAIARQAKAEAWYDEILALPFAERTEQLRWIFSKTQRPRAADLSPEEAAMPVSDKPPWMLVAEKYGWTPPLAQRALPEPEHGA